MIDWGYDEGELEWEAANLDETGWDKGIAAND